MLQLRTGFLLEDGTMIEAHGGHRKTAFDYIKQHSELMKLFKESGFNEEDDFLLYRLNAIRLSHSRGHHLLHCTMITYLRNENIIQEYVHEGYIVHILGNNFHLDNTNQKNELSDSSIIVEGDRTHPEVQNTVNFTSTVIRMPDGRYVYNPARNGD